MPPKHVVGNKINYYKKLARLIETGELGLIDVITVPRCRGTVFSRALGQSTDVQGLAHEPFEGTHIIPSTKKPPLARDLLPEELYGLLDQAESRFQELVANPECIHGNEPEMPVVFDCSA